MDNLAINVIAILVGLVFGMASGVYFTQVYSSESKPVAKFSKITGVLTTMGGIPNSVFYYLIKGNLEFMLIPYLFSVLLPITIEYYRAITNYTPSDPKEFER